MAKAKKLPSGNWRCRICYTDDEGKYIRKSFTAETKKEADFFGVTVVSTSRIPVILRS